MEFVRTGIINPNALERLVEINPLEDALRFPLKRLNYLLGFIKERKPEILEPFVSNLTFKYRSLLDSQYDSRPLELSDIPSDMTHLIEHSKLTTATIRYLLQIIQLPKEIDWSGIFETPQRKQLRFYLHNRYYSLLALTETLDREDAIALYKRFVTHFLIDVRDSERERYDNLETLFEERTKPQEKPSEWAIVRGMIGDGKHAYRNNNCLWVDALDDLTDPEIKYYICCYGDYEGARNYHESVVLTMEHTIAQGDPYCSRVLHDTRVDWNLKHPPREFWDNMEPK